MKFVLYAFLILAAYFPLHAQAPPPLTDKDFERVDPNARRGFGHPYYLYVPPELKVAAARNEVHTILVLPNNTGKVDDDFAVHKSDVKRRMSMGGAIASLLKVAVLMPVFPRPKTDWRIYTHALDRDSMVTDRVEYRRLDMQMLAMINDARSRMRKSGLKFDKRVLINGFSAQGMFANRFTFLHPDRVKAAVIGSPGGWPIAPAEKFGGKDLRYPIGVADLKLVAGKRLDLQRLRRVPLLVFMGDRDENDSVAFDDSYDEADRKLINALFGSKPVDRWETSRKLYADAGLQAEFRLYPGVGHTVSPAIRDDVTAFLLKHK